MTDEIVVQELIQVVGIQQPLDELEITFPGPQGPPGVQGPQGPTGPQGPQGPPGAAYVHEQPVAAATWNIVHNLGIFPSVTVVDTAGTVVEGDVVYVDANNLQVSFSAPFSGKAYLN